MFKRQGFNSATLWLAYLANKMLRDGYWALVSGHLAIVHFDVPSNEPSNGFNQFQSPSRLGSSANVLRQSMYDTACLVVPPRNTSFDSI